MGNDYQGHEGHSAEYFGDTRDDWYNRDFVRLMAERWGLSRARDVLDVGCGVGHWGRLVDTELPRGARVTGVDPEPRWVEEATKRARENGLADRFHYQTASAEALPFADGSFDLVTCQTVLIHVRDPRAVLAEMIRVTRSGGRVAVAEPNNVASGLLSEQAAQRAPIEDVLRLVRLQMTCERGKVALGEGNNSLGELIPGLFHALGLKGITVHLNDRAHTLLPPYESKAARASVEEHTKNVERDFWIWSRDDTRRFFLAGGGQAHEFEVLWGATMAEQKGIAAAMAQGQHTCAGATVMYLVSGEKP